MLSLDRQERWRAQFRAEHPKWQPATERFAELVRQHLSPTATVLDLGCGRGGLVEQLTEDGFAIGRVVGVDPDWASLHEHRLPLPRVQALTAGLPFADDSFEVVYASWLLEHLPAPGADFREVARVLQPGGAFVFVTPNRLHPLALLNRLFGRLGKLQGRLVERLYGRAEEDTFPTHYRANSIADVEALAGRAGLRVARLETVADPTYLAFNAPLFRAASLFELRLPSARRLHLVGVLKRELL